MPSIYTHYAVARTAFNMLSKTEQETLRPFLSVYFFGAQGADFCFFYKPLGAKKKNLGSYLHREGGYTAFCVLKTLARSSPLLRAYALGYITHYAVDVTFHPYVYAVSNNSLFLHSRIENALDYYVRRTKLPNTQEHKPFIQIALTPKEIDELFIVYATITARLGFSVLEKNSFRRAIKLFFAYLPMSNVFFRKENVLTMLSKEQPAQQLADELFMQSVQYAYALMLEFLSAMQNNLPLERKVFGKNYLTGHISSSPS